MLNTVHNRKAGVGEWYRRRLVVVEPAVFERLLVKGRAFRIEIGVPEDAKIVGATVDDYARIILVVEHPSFDPVLMGRPYPGHDIVIAEINE